MHNLQYNARIVLEKRMRWPAHVACVGWKGDPHRVLVEKPEGKSHLGRPMHRLYYIQINVKERSMGRCRVASYGPGCRSQRDYRDLSDDSCYGMCARRCDILWNVCATLRHIMECVRDVAAYYGTCA